MRDALNAEAANSPVPKAQWISAIQEGDMGCIINMGDRKLLLLLFSPFYMCQSHMC